MSDLEDYGWRGKRMRHADGRTGVIVGENATFLQVTVTIKVDGTDERERIHLNSDSKDSGATGWSWRYASLDTEGDQWALLGDHNPPEPTPAQD